LMAIVKYLGSIDLDWVATTLELDSINLMAIVKHLGSIDLDWVVTTLRLDSINWMANSINYY